MSLITPSIIWDGLGVLSLVASSVIVIRSQIPKQTILNLSQLNDVYEKRIKALEDQRTEDARTQIENVKAIADLQGQVKVYKELPLQELATAMQEISRVNQKIAESNEKILKTLEGSALIAATDKEALIPHSQTIDEQVVRHQVVDRRAK